MYNRYIRNDQGVYTRITEEEAPNEAAGTRSQPSPGSSSPHSEDSQNHGPQGNWQRPDNPPPFGPPPPGGGKRASDTSAGFFRHILDQLHLDHIDTGDLLLLGLLFFLFREGADEELLVALGLLLIL